MEKTHTLVTQDGVTITYRLWRQGKQSRPLIVLLHGMASNMTRWSEFLQHTTLKNDWDIMRLDLRGHAESLYRGPLNAEIWSRDLLELLDAEGYRQALLIGHSLGAQVAVRFAYLYPQRVSALVLIDPVLGKTSMGVALWGRRIRYLIRAFVLFVRFLNHLGLRRRHIPKRDLWALDEQVRQTLLAKGKSKELIRAYSSPWPDLKQFPTANYLEEIIEMVRPLPPLSAVKAPVLVVLSTGVTYMDPAVTRKMITQFQHADTAAIDAYHWPLTERPVEVRQAIERWCSSLRQRTA
jgi:pimeloyl-ACP methyl ester carboxylesterase